MGYTGPLSPQGDTRSQAEADALARDALAAARTALQAGDYDAGHGWEHYSGRDTR